LRLTITLMPLGAFAVEETESGSEAAPATEETTPATEETPAQPEQTGFKASKDLVELIKKWEGFSKYPVWDYGQYSVGYGTRAPDEHLERYRREGISEEEATQLLEQYMEGMGNSVNSFIDKFGLKVNQGQFDAMLSLTYNCGGRWMLEPSTLRTSILDGWTGSDFIYAFGQWSTAGGVTLTGLVRRRLAEANMYLNGVYSTSLPANYCYVQYDANGGYTETVTQGYDSNEKPAVRSVPTYENYVFKGW
jgi:GH24 family phage-related lysozyme (muramidase)